MKATKIAHDADGNLSIVMVEGRSFVHGSILDSECARRDAEINRLRSALHEILEEPLDDCGYGDAKRIAGKTLYPDRY